MICAGDNSTASGPVLLFSSPGGANGRRIFSRYAPSAIVTPPMRIFSQSSSVLGPMSFAPCFVTTAPTASKMLSAMGSSMSRISSLTETTGLRSPHSCDPEAAAGGVLDEEQVDTRMPAQTSAATAQNAVGIRGRVIDPLLLLSGQFRCCARTQG